jgi:hypothetical protein
MSSGNTTEIWISLPRAFGSKKEYVGIPGSLSIDELIEFAVGRLEEALDEVCRDGYEIEEAEPRYSPRGWIIDVTYYCGDQRMATTIALREEKEGDKPLYTITISEPRKARG